MQHHDLDGDGSKRKKQEISPKSRNSAVSTKENLEKLPLLAFQSLFCRHPGFFFRLLAAIELFVPSDPRSSGSICSLSRGHPSLL